MDILSSSLPPPPIALSCLFHSSCNPPEGMFRLHFSVDCGSFGLLRIVKMYLELLEDGFNSNL